MDPALNNLNLAREQMSEFSTDAQTALLEQKLTDLKQSVLLLSVPDGAAMSKKSRLGEAFAYALNQWEA